jgi:biofilm PGA synthesis protein PgaA
MSNPFSILALANYNDSTIDEAGGVLRGSWMPDDHWHVTLQAERFSDATPLRALYYGIRMDRIAGAVSYRWQERSKLAASLSSGYFTDDNDRVEGALVYTGRMVDRPRFDVDTILDVYGSTNSLDDAPYYNPEADLKIKGEVRAEHVLYRYYEKSLVQQLGAGLGIYAQENYDTGAIGSLHYELRYQYYPMIEARLAGEIGQNRYDGEDEPYYKLNFMIHAKF